MTAWAIRGGKDGEYEKPALENGTITTGWNNLGDLSNLQSRDEMKDLLWEKDPEAKTGAIAIYATHLWNFTKEISIGDLLLLPRQSDTGLVAIGNFTSDYQFRLGNKPSPHLRTVKWVTTALPKASLRQDILAAVQNVPLSIFRLGGENAEAYLRVAAQPGVAEYIETAIKNYLSKNYPHLTNG